MSAETSVAFALFFVGFLIAAGAIYSSIDYYKNLEKNAQYDQGVMKKNEMQTDITIMNVTLMNESGSSRLNITITNTGKTTLNASSMNVFVNGILYNYNLSSAGNTWIPERRTNITIYPINYTNTTGGRLKIITENGISDYALVS